MKLKDSLQAKALSAGSAVANRFSPEMNVVGRLPSPNHIPLRWRHLPIDAAASYGQWANFDPADRDAVLPSKFKLAAIIRVDRATFDHDREWSPSSPQAIAYRLGTTVMFGVSKHNQDILGLAHDQAEDYEIAMGLGSGPLDAQVGIAVPLGKRRDWLFRPLHDGVRPGPVIPIIELPEYIPLV